MCSKVSKCLQLNTKKTKVLWLGSGGVNLRNVSRADRCLLDHESSLLLSFANQFLPPSAPAFHSTLSPPQSDCSVGVCIHHLSSRLLQLYSSQSASTNFGTAAESP